MIHKGAQRITQYHKVVPKPYPTIPFSNHTLYSREDPRPLVIAISAIMIVVHSIEVSTLYPRVVISSLLGWLENLLFTIFYTSFGVWPIDHYTSLQRSTIVVCHALLWFPHQRPLLHRVGKMFQQVCRKVLCQSPLNRARHATYSIPN
jgi:hypothetical protein